jgi:hypothetical protein
VMASGHHASTSDSSQVFERSDLAQPNREVRVAMCLRF